MNRTKNWMFAAILLSASLIAPLSAHTAPPASRLRPPDSLRFADPDASVEAGQEALGGSRRFPWYDGQTDGVRRIDFRTARRLSSGGGWNLNFLNLSLFELLAWTVVLVVLGLLFYLLIRAYLNREKRAAMSQTADAVRGGHLNEAARVEALPFQLKRGTTDLLGEARRNYEQGNYGEAIIYLFSYQLVQMDKGQVIRLTKGKTNRQYIREIGPRRPLRDLVEQTMTVFEDVFFGNYSIHRDRFESCWNRLGEFEHLLERGTA